MQILQENFFASYVKLSGRTIVVLLTLSNIFTLLCMQQQKTTVQTIFMAQKKMHQKWAHKKCNRHSFAFHLPVKIICNM